MECQTARDLLLQFDLSEADRTGLLRALTHVDQCLACRSATGDYDRIREALRPEPDGEPVGGWAAFEDRLAHDVTSPRHAVPLTPLALAACLAMAVSGWCLYLWPNRTAETPRQNLPETPAFVTVPSEQEIADRAKLFDQVSQVFDDRAGWVLLADRRSDMGMSSGAPTKERSVLLVRISISHEGAPFSTVDLLVVPGQVARSTVPAAGGLQLKYEVTTSQSDPSHLRIVADVERLNHAARRVGTLGSDLRIRLGQIASIGQVVTGSGTFECNVGLYRVEPSGQRS
ncbi:MAG: hypothetical protein HY718_09800 [Planctomycetes bacterium]|nr:hypothetical protein [Planctomycetota bacterium]